MKTIIVTFVLVAGLATPLFAEKIQYSGYLLDDAYQFGVRNPVSQIALTPLKILKQVGDHMGDNWNLGK